jgi:hypothetical protein
MRVGFNSKLNIYTVKSKLLAFVFLIPISLFSQERKILGRILDFDTQKPVKNANIVILGTTSGTFSNQLGFFEITIDPSKHKALVVSHIGFKTSEVLIPAEDRIKFSLKKEYILMSQLNLSRYPGKVVTEFKREESESKNDGEVIRIELGATYPIGLNNFYDFIGNSLTSQIPEGDQKSFDVAFTINEEGRAVGISISDSTASIRNAVTLAFEKMRDWTPAMQRQNKAQQHFVLPIVRLKGDVASLDLRNFYEFISKNIKYPAQARRMGVEGVVYVEFLTDHSGNVLGTKSIKDIGADCGDEVQRIIAAVPKDLIRSLYDETKSVNFILPVSFGFERPFKNQPFAPASDALLLSEISVVATGIERETRVLGNSNDSHRAVSIPVVNGLTSLPLAMKDPKAVRRVSLVNNNLSVFPSDILKLTNLLFLDLEQNQIQTLPGEIDGLTKLEELYLLGNRIQRLPSNLGNLKKLRILGLAYNQLETFPLEITSLEKLEALDLSDNQLSTLPAEIDALKNLKLLVLSNNNITNIPREFYGLRKLEKIYLEGNPIDQKDIELLKSTFNKTEIVFRPKSEISASPLEPEKTQAADEVFLVVEDPATFPGGMEKFYDYMSKNIKTPNEVRSGKVSGKVFVEFVIDSTGQIPADDVKVIKGLCKACDEEVVRVVKGSPNWNPGFQRGKPVRQRMVLPIMFR